MRLLVAAACAALCLVPSALAAGAPFTDATGDAGAALDITGVTVSNDSTGATTFRIAFAGSIARSSGIVDGLDIYVDTDGNAGTGLDGDDYLLDWGTMGVFKWSSSAGEWQSVDGTLFLRTGTTDATVTVQRVALGDPHSFGFHVVVTAWSGTTMLADDAAPDSGRWSYTLTGLEASFGLSAVPTPAVPVAGRSFRVGSVAGVSSRTGKSFRLEGFSCAIRVAGRLLPGGCSVQLPASARGKRLDVAVTGTYHGDVSQLSWQLRVR